MAEIRCKASSSAISCRRSSSPLSKKVEASSAAACSTASRALAASEIMAAMRSASNGGSWLWSPMNSLLPDKERGPNRSGPLALAASSTTTQSNWASSSLNCSMSEDVLVEKTRLADSNTSALRALAPSVSRAFSEKLSSASQALLSAAMAIENDCGAPLRRLESPTLARYESAVLRTSSSVEMTPSRPGERTRIASPLASPSNIRTESST